VAVKIGVVGIGVHGLHHVRLLASMAETDFVGVFDTNQEVRERVAAELETPGPSQSERTVLTARLNDLQRQVNQLDGIVAGEGQESGGATRAPRAADVERVTPHSTESDQAAQVQGTPAAGSAPAGTSPASTGSTAVGATQDDSTQDVATQLDVVA